MSKHEGVTVKSHWFEILAQPLFNYVTDFSQIC